MLRFLTAGESHGKALTAILEGMVANLPLTVEDINKDLARRQLGYGRGGRMKIEKDQAEILSGVRRGLTLGSPIALTIPNHDFANWEEDMTIAPGKTSAQVTQLRPGHADFAGTFKYDQDDIRNILERASARETAARVAVGAIARKLLDALNIKVLSYVTAIGPVRGTLPSSLDYNKFFEKAEKSAVRCPDEKCSLEMINYIDEASEAGDSLGGVYEVVVLGAPIGLGSHVHWDRRLTTRLTAALMSIPAMKGVEIGIGFAGSQMPGSQLHDEIFYNKTKGYYRKTNNAGGLEGGMTNGEPIVLRVAMKPIATLKKPLQSVDLKNKKAVAAHSERSDVCAVPAAGVIGEAMVALEIAQACLEKFGGDSLAETRQNYNHYKKLTHR